MSWRPIETAPRDGTRILVVGTTKGLRRAHVAHWHEGSNYYCWLVSETNGKCGTIHELVVGKTTHWRPLPKLPRERR